MDGDHVLLGDPVARGHHPARLGEARNLQGMAGVRVTGLGESVGAPGTATHAGDELLEEAVP